MPRKKKWSDASKNIYRYQYIEQELARQQYERQVLEDRVMDIYFDIKTKYENIAKNLGRDFGRYHKKDGGACPNNNYKSVEDTYQLDCSPGTSSMYTLEEKRELFRKISEYKKCLDARVDTFDFYEMIVDEMKDVLYDITDDISDINFDMLNNYHYMYEHEKNYLEALRYKLQEKIDDLEKQNNSHLHVINVISENLNKCKNVVTDTYGSMLRDKYDMLIQNKINSIRQQLDDYTTDSRILYDNIETIAT